MADAEEACGQATAAILTQGKTMNRRRSAMVACLSFTLILGLIGIEQGRAQAPKTAYPNMAPLDQYLMADRNAEIALARSAAPDAISGDAKILVLGRHGYETAVEGKNGFVCIDLPKSPVMLNPQFKGAQPIDVFIVPVGRWSDGSAAPVM